MEYRQCGAGDTKSTVGYYDDSIIESSTAKWYYDKVGDDTLELSGQIIDILGVLPTSAIPRVCNGEV